MLCSRSASFISTTLVSAACAAASARASLISAPASAAVQGHDPGHHRRSSGAEFSAHRGERIRGVLHRVVQYRRAQGLVVRAEPREDRRHAHRVGDVWVAAAPELTLVASCRYVIGPLEQVDVGIRPGGSERFPKACQRVGRGDMSQRWVAVHDVAPCLPVLRRRGSGHAFRACHPYRHCGEGGGVGVRRPRYFPRRVLNGQESAHPGHGIRPSPRRPHSSPGDRLTKSR